MIISWSQDNDEKDSRWWFSQRRPNQKFSREKRSLVDYNLIFFYYYILILLLSYSRLKLDYK